MTQSDRFQEGEFSRDAQRSASDVDHAQRIITLRVPARLHDDLAELAHVRRTSMNRLCRAILERELAGGGPSRASGSNEGRRAEGGEPTADNPTGERSQP